VGNAEAHNRPGRARTVGATGAVVFEPGEPLSKLPPQPHTCGHNRASPKKSIPKTALNRRMLYRKSQKTLMLSARLASPITLGPALSCVVGHGHVALLTNEPRTALEHAVGEVRVRQHPWSRAWC
jgi:hypothetical protein